MNLINVYDIYLFTCHKYWNANLGCHKHGTRYSGASIKFLHRQFDEMVNGINENLLKTMTNTLLKT